MHRSDDDAARQKRAKEREQIRQDHERHVPDYQHAFLFLTHHWLLLESEKPSFIGLASHRYSLLAIIPASCCCTKGSSRGVSCGSRFCTSHRKGRNPKAGKIDYETISSYMEDRIHDPPALGSPQEAPFHTPRLQTPGVFTSVHRQQSSPGLSRTGERTRLPHAVHIQTQYP